MLGAGSDRGVDVPDVLEEAVKVSGDVNGLEPAGPDQCQRVGRVERQKLGRLRLSGHRPNVQLSRPGPQLCDARALPGLVSGGAG
jgi:hypothetical protein